DGIRDGHVTGVQTCALPISGRDAQERDPAGKGERMRKKGSELQETPIPVGRAVRALLLVAILTAPAAALARPRAQQAEAPQADRSEERRVGKECGRGRWWF